MTSAAEQLSANHRQTYYKSILRWDYALVRQADGYSLVVKQFPYIGVLGIKNIKRRCDALRLARQYCRSNGARLYK